MQFASFDEFWAALGPLCDETLEMKQSIEEIRHSIAEFHGASKATNSAAAHLLSAVERHQRVVEPQERRLDRTEITVEAILEDLRRHREQRPSQ
jgi:hypothetical protein